MQNKYIPKLPRFRIWRATVTVSFPCDLPVTIIWNRQIGYGTVEIPTGTGGSGESAFVRI